MTDEDISELKRCMKINTDTVRVYWIPNENTAMKVVEISTRHDGAELVHFNDAKSMLLRHSDMNDFALVTRLGG